MRDMYYSDLVKIVKVILTEIWKTLTPHGTQLMPSRPPYQFPPPSLVLLITSPLCILLPYWMPEALPSCQSQGPSQDWVLWPLLTWQWLDFCIIWVLAHFLLFQVVLLCSFLTPVHWNSWPFWILLFFIYYMSYALLLSSSHGHAAW